jgi:LPXTG-motif cell wall-anchored protein
MRRSIWEKIEEILRKHILHGKWVRSIIALSCVVIFITTYVLVMPAVTLSGTPDCGQEEHRHTDDCYETQSEQICGLEEHTHSDDCYDEDGNLICGLEEHVHNDGCYETEEVLTCGMEEHIHTSDCYNGADAEEADSEDSSSSSDNTGESESKTEQSEDVTDEVNSEDAETVASPEATEAADPEGPAESEEPASGDLLVEGEDYTITVSYTEEANLPADVSLKVEEITNKEEFEGYKSQVEEEILDPESQKVTAARFFDITLLDSEGNELHPEKAVTVVIETKDTLKENEELQVCHFDQEQEKPVIVKSQEIINETYKEDNLGVQFEAETFYVYGIVRTKPIGTTVLTADGETYTVTVSYTEEANLPADVSLKVEEITNTEEYEGYKSQVEEEILDSESKKVTAARFFDITLMDSEGNELHPEKSVTVVIETKDTWKENEEVQVCHFDQEKDKPVVVESQEITNKTYKEDNLGVQFEAESFSVYGIVGTELKTEFTISNQDGEDVTYLVTVTYGPEAEIPEGSTLRVTPFAEDSAEFEYAKKAVLADKQAKGEEVFLPEFGFAAMDISILNPAGEEIEPAAPVQVDIKIKSLPNVENLDDVADSIEIQHHVETGDQVVVDTVYDGGATEAKFDVVTNEKAIAEGTAVDPDSYILDKVTDDSSEADEFDASFETELFSTYTISYYYNFYSKRIHYVDTAGNSLTPTMTPNFNARHQFLIYDIEGYEYDSTHVGSRTGTTIQPILRANSDNGLYYSSNIQYRNGSSWSNLNNDDIYVVYKAKQTPTQGGSPTLKPVRPGDEPENPSILKESEPNDGDGTADLSLSITGHTKDREVQKLADVIVVFDISGSMNTNDMSGTRLNAAKNAVKNLADQLATKTNSDGEPLIRMSLISFSTSAEEVMDLTDLTAAGVRDYKEAVDHLGAGGGTNWDYALQLSNEQSVDSGRATFVIFVTDGDPTFRVTRGNVSDSDLDMYSSGTYQYYRTNNVFGAGDSDRYSRNYDAAVTQGQAIVAANKNLYSIGISNDVTNVESFNSDAGGNGAYKATDTDSLKKAFDDIQSAIVAMMGFSDIQMTDGITEMTQTVDKSGLTTTDGSFTYWKKAKDATSFVEWNPASEGALEAEYDEKSGAVKWNMGTNFMPEDGATYKVTWKVWPSQDAYDILAKCKNDPSFYDTLTDAQKAQITRTGTSPNYSYTLRTNEPGAGTTYKSATKSGSGITTEGDDKYLEFNQVDPLGLASSQISVKKIWDNQLDDRTITGSYDFPVKAGDTDFGAVTLSSSQNPAWQNTFYISTGLMTTNPYVIYEHGHDYTVEEPAELSYQWDFKSDVYHPMVINNQTVMLVKVDTEAESDYTIDGKYYKALSGEAVLTATNERRSNLNISKTVVDRDGNHVESDQAFTFTVVVNEGHDDEVWLSAYDTNAGATVMDPGIVTGDGVEYQSSDGYFHAPSGTTLTLTLKDGWNYRFTNLSVGSTYSIEENSPVPDGFTFVRAEATATNGAAAGTVTGQKTEGTIDKSNSVYTASYTNRANITTLKFRKTDDKGTALAGAVVEIVKGSTGIDGSPFTTTTEDIELTLFDGIYKVRETSAPAGYNVLAGDMYFKTSNGTVTITDQDGNEKTYEDFTMDTENGVVVLKLKNHPGQELPMTGGSGTLPYTLGGLMLIIASALMYGFRMRRGERRLN